MSVKSPRRRGDQEGSNLGIDVCDICYMCFHSGTSLSIHKRIHWRDCIFDCSTCNKRFSSLTNLRAHQKLHESGSPTANPAAINVRKAVTGINTGIASIASSSSASIVKKRVRNRDEQPVKSKLVVCHKSHYYVRRDKAETKMAGTMMSCLLCSFTFEGDRALTKHIRNVHRGQDMSVIDTIIPSDTILCDNCDMVFNSDKALIRHAKTCYDEPIDFDDSDSDDNAKVVETPFTVHSFGNPYPCPHCDRILNNKYSLGGHMAQVHNAKKNKVRRFKCGQKQKGKAKPKKDYVAEERPEKVRVKVNRASLAIVNLKECSKVSVTQAVVPANAKKKLCQVKRTAKGKLVLKCEHCNRCFRKKKFYNLHKKNNLCQFDKHGNGKRKIVTGNITQPFVVLEKLDEKFLRKTLSDNTDTVAILEKVTATSEVINMDNKTSIEPVKALKCPDCAEICENMMSFDAHYKQHRKHPLLESTMVLEMEKNTMNNRDEASVKESNIKQKPLGKFSKASKSNNEVSVGTKDSREIVAIAENVGIPVRTKALKDGESKMNEEITIEKESANDCLKMDESSSDNEVIVDTVETEMKRIQQSNDDALPLEISKPASFDSNSTTANLEKSKRPLNLTDSDKKEMAVVDKLSLAISNPLEDSTEVSAKTKDIPQIASNKGIVANLEGQSVTHSLNKDTSNSAKLVDSNEMEIVVLNEGSPSEIMVSQLAEDEINLKDSENSELRGIIEFINDCTE